MNTLRSDAPVALEVEDAALARVGEVLGGRWRIDDVLGVGGMAVVYGATHRNGARVAIKVPRSGDPALTSRFVKEGWIGNRVDHPGVVKTLDDGVTADGLPFQVMERLSGETLEARIEREGRLAPPEVVRIVSAICDVLAAAHAAGIVHRDVKPSNVFLTSEGGVKLLDFGIACEVVRSGGSATMAGFVLGTPGFLSPEQAMGALESIGPRTDLWAAGALAFAALTGTTVHGGETPMEKVAAAMMDAPPVRSLAADIPTPIAAVLDRALAYDLDARFASALEMRDALATAKAIPAEPTAPRRRRGRALVAGVAVVAAWLVVGVAVKLAHEDDRGQPRGASLVSDAPAPPPASVLPSASPPLVAPVASSAPSASVVKRPPPRRRSADPMADRF